MHWSLATVALFPRGGIAYADSEQQRCVIEWAARAGFEGVEISPQWFNIEDLPPSALRSFSRDAGSAGLKISGINVNRCLFTRGDQAEYTLARIRRAIDAAVILETSCVTLSLSLPLGESQRPLLRGSDCTDDERQAAAHTLKEFASQADRCGIELSLELHDDGLLDTAEYCLDMVRRVDAPNVGVNPDLGNFVRSSASSEKWLEQLRLLAPLANNWHVKSYRAGEPASLWDGDIDYRQAFSAMHAAGYDGWVSIESYAQDAFELQERSVKYLRQIQDEVLSIRKAQEPA